MNSKVILSPSCKNITYFVTIDICLVRLLNHVLSVLLYFIFSSVPQFVRQFVPQFFHSRSSFSLVNSLYLFVRFFFRSLVRTYLRSKDNARDTEVEKLLCHYYIYKLACVVHTPVTLKLFTIQTNQALQHKHTDDSFSNYLFPTERNTTFLRIQNKPCTMLCFD